MGTDGHLGLGHNRNVGGTPDTGNVTFLFRFVSFFLFENQI